MNEEPKASESTETSPSADAELTPLAERDLEAVSGGYDGCQNPLYKGA